MNYLVLARFSWRYHGKSARSSEKAIIYRHIKLYLFVFVIHKQKTLDIFRLNIILLCGKFKCFVGTNKIFVLVNLIKALG